MDAHTGHCNDRSDRYEYHVRLYRQPFLNEKAEPSSGIPHLNSFEWESKQGKDNTYKRKAE